MYLPELFKEADPQRIRQLIENYPFATLISGDTISHLPLAFEEGGPRLIGHMARPNSHWRSTDVTVIFHGPHTYVTPTWYPEPDVPTWNYAVVHVRGVLKPIGDFKETVRILKRLSEKFDPNWRMTLPEDLRSEADLLGAIVGFHIDDLKFEAKFKLSQNRTEAERAGVLRGLEGRADEMSREVLKLMKPV